MKPHSVSPVVTVTPISDDGSIALEDFLPYRLSVLSNTVSRAIARLYEQEFGISISEWRLMAVIARFGPSSAIGVCDRTRMDKVQVSRAVARAMERGLIDRQIDPKDRRRSILSLTEQGREIHDAIVPRAIDVDRRLSTVLSSAERNNMFDMLERIQKFADALDQPRG